MNKMKNSFHIIILFFITVSLPVTAQKRTVVKDQKPNVIVIYTDDHRYTGVNAFGASQVQTPNLNALVSDGVSFSNAYLMGAFTGATCIPSRAMLLTGRNLFELEGRGKVISEAHQTMGETFQQNGYYTHIVGKWHQNNASLVRSFNSGDKIMGRSAYLVDHYRMPLWDWSAAPDFTRKDAYLLTFNNQKEIVRRALTIEDKRGPIGTELNGPHTSEIFAEDASKFIKEYQKKKPFFMYLAFHAPHDPRQAPEEFKKMYPVENIELPPSYMQQHPFDNGHMFLRDEQLAPWPRTTEIAKQELADYYAIITHLDTQIGKVIKALKESGAYDNTLIVFAGDSGLAVGNHGLIGKQNIYDEDGVHIPLVFSGNLIKDKGSQKEAFVYNFDIFPTICDIVGIKTPASVTGKSLQPILNNQLKTVRDHTYHAYRQFQRAYRKGDYKLIEYVRAKDVSKDVDEHFRGSRVTQLFNVKNDPWEIYDLSFFPDHKELLEKMQSEMKAKAVELGDQIQNVAEEKFDFWDYYHPK